MNCCKPFDISVDFLVEIINPFQVDVWGVGQLTKDMVAQAQFNLESWNPDDYGQWWTIQQHAGRVRYLAEFGWDDPILVDVGIPVLDYYQRTMLDGCHRLAAAIYRGDIWILTAVQGQLSVVKDHIRKLQC